MLQIIDLDHKNMNNIKKMKYNYKYTEFRSIPKLICLLKQINNLGC